MKPFEWKHWYCKSPRTRLDQRPNHWQTQSKIKTDERRKRQRERRKQTWEARFKLKDGQVALAYSKRKAWLGDKQVGRKDLYNRNWKFEERISYLEIDQLRQLKGLLSINQRTWLVKGIVKTFDLRKWNTEGMKQSDVLKTRKVLVRTGYFEQLTRFDIWREVKIRKWAERNKGRTW